MAKPKTPAAAAKPNVKKPAANGATVELEMLTGYSGPDINLVRGQRHRFPPREAAKLVQAGFAKEPASGR